ncbi:MAG TPA: metallophosphoesterase, partial [bacterium]|nr:metallophosphoesterase [bacterium]
MILGKGPILHRVEDKQIVRLQAASLTKPAVEWRKESSEPPHKEEMKPAGSEFWQAELSDDAKEYRVVDGDHSTPWYPVVNGGKSKDSFTFIAYGDNRSGWGSPRIHQSLVDYMEKEKAAFVLNTGDLVFQGERQVFWDLFFRQIQRMSASVPYQPSMGNHDYSKENNYRRYFGLGPEGASYYYFSYGKAHFIALDTTINFSPHCPQYRFLEDRLKALQVSDLIVVFFHHPAYSWSLHSSDPRVQAHLVPLFEKYGVDLVLTGHDHNYQRVGPVNGVTYVVTGGGGGPLYRVRENPLLKNYKVVYHYITLEVDDQKV